MKKLLFICSWLVTTQVLAAPLQSVTIKNENPANGDTLIFNLPSTVKAEIAPGMTTELSAADIRYLSNMKGKILISSKNGISFICGQTLSDSETKEGQSSLTSQEPEYLFEGKVTITASTNSSVPAGYENSCTFNSKLS